MSKVHVIIGGAGGIGMSIAECLSSEGTVIVTGINDDETSKALKELEEKGIKAEGAICDVTSEESIKELAEKAKGLGEIGAVVNCAGVSGANAKTSLVLNIDLMGTEKVIKGFGDYVGEGSSGIMIASMMGSVIPDKEDLNELLSNPLKEGYAEKLEEIIGDDSNLAYNMAKKGVRLLIKKYADEWGAKGARITSISPGIIMTPMAEEAASKYPEEMNKLKSITPAGRTGKPEDIAKVAKFLASDEAAFITGSDILVDGGLANNLQKLSEMKK